MAKFRRSQKLPKRRLQLKLTFIFVGLSALGLVMQYLLFMSSVSNAALELPNDSAILMDGLNGMLIKILLVTALIVLPITLIVGILTTFKIAGPIYRFERFLESISRGERPPDCSLRKGDDLVEFCDLLNRATAPLRAQDSAGDTGPPVAAGPAMHNSPAPLPLQNATITTEAVVLDPRSSSSS